MKLFLLAVCFVALAAARPGKGGDDKGDDGKKGPNPVKGLVKLCLGLAEEAVNDGSKRSWEDVFGQLTPICKAILEELEDKDESEDEDKPRPSGPPPSGAPPSGAPIKRMNEMDGDDDRKGGKGGKKGGDKGGNGPRPSGPPPSGPPPKDWLDERKMGKGGDKDESSQAEALLRICEGLARMAEREEEEGMPKQSIEALLEGMTAVCQAALEQAVLDADN